MLTDNVSHPVLCRLKTFIHAVVVLLLCQPVLAFVFYLFYFILFFKTNAPFPLQMLRIEDETKLQEDAKPKYARRKFIYSIEV